jgi:secondary thiamine-phosphate synthase enzyme
MGVQTFSFAVKTKGETDIINITTEVESIIRKSSMNSGIATLFISGSTAGITTIEYESGLVNDLKDAYERLAPRRNHYEHNARWGDGNGFAHIRASFTGQDMSVPFSRGKLLLGTWQQIIIIDFDNRARNRDITVQLIGE